MIIFMLVIEHLLSRKWVSERMLFSCLELSDLCEDKHDFEGTGKSLRIKPNTLKGNESWGNGECLICLHAYEIATTEEVYFRFLEDKITCLISMPASEPCLRCGERKRKRSKFCIRCWGEVRKENVGKRIEAEGKVKIGSKWLPGMDCEDCGKRIPASGIIGLCRDCRIRATRRRVRLAMRFCEACGKRIYGELGLCVACKQKALEEWKKDHPEEAAEEKRKRQNAYSQQKRDNDPQWYLRCIMHNQVLRALRGRKNGRRWEECVGYASEYVYNKLGARPDGGYDLDHVVPVGVFTFTDVCDIEFKLCFYPENYRWLQHDIHKCRPKNGEDIPYKEFERILKTGLKFHSVPEEQHDQIIERIYNKRVTI